MGPWGPSRTPDTGDPLNTIPLPDPAAPQPRSRSEVDDGLSSLLSRAGHGDEQAFAELYDATAARVHGVALRVVRDPAQAEEVVQEAYLDAWRHANRFDPERGRVVTWLLTIAHRKAVDRVRSSQSSRDRDAAHHLDVEEVGSDTTAEAVLRADSVRGLRAALRALTPRQREAVELAYFGGHTHTEVAARLGLPLGTAKTRIRDGLIALRSVMPAPG